jgi:adenine deaminase
MKGLVCAAALLALAAAAMTAGAAPPNAKQVNAQGCVQAGVEASCLVVKDASSGKLYNLLIKGARPATGTGIAFTGTSFSGATTCMQGTPVQVTTWTRNDALKCSMAIQKNARGNVQ